MSIYLNNSALLKNHQEIMRIIYKEILEISNALKYTLNKENKPVTEEKIIFKDGVGSKILSDVMTITSRSDSTDSIKLKKKSYNRG